MSTKIYDAWKWEKSYDDLIIILQGLNRLYIKDCKEYINKITPDMPELDQWDYKKYITDNIKKGMASNANGEPYDIGVNAVVYQYDGKIVLHFFNFNSHKYLRTKEQIEKNFKFFGYWNNTDPDENCSEKEWKEREDFFEGMFEKYGSDTPSDCGLIYNFYNTTNVFMMVNDIVRDRRNLTKEKD